MVTIVNTITVQRPITKIYNYVTNISNWGVIHPEMAPQIVNPPDHPMHVGETFIQNYESGPIKMEFLWTVKESTRPIRWIAEYIATKPSRIMSVGTSTMTYQLTGIDCKMRVEMRISYAPEGFLAKVANWLFIERFERKAAHYALAYLKDAMESGKSGTHYIHLDKFYNKRKEVIFMTSENRSAPLDEAFASDFLKRLRALFNAHDTAIFTELMAEDVVFEHPLAPATMHGRAEVSAFYTNNIWKAIPDAAVEPADGPFFDPHAPRIIMVWLGGGTHNGPLDPPGLPPTGKRFQGHVWEMFEFRDGLVSRVVQVFDTADVMRQLGVLPAVP